MFDVQRGVPIAGWDGSALGTAGDPTLSPDGRRIAFVMGNFRDENIAVCSLADFIQTGGRPQVSTLVRNEWHFDQVPPISIGNCQPAFSPDGRRIAFIRYAMGTGSLTGNVFVVNADGTGLAAVTNLPPNVFPGWPTWSPDGRKIAFQVMVSKGNVFKLEEKAGLGIPVNIWSINADGSDLTQLTNDGTSGEPSGGP